MVSRVNLRHEMRELHLPLLEPKPALIILTDEETETLEKQMTPRTFSTLSQQKGAY